MELLELREEQTLSRCPMVPPKLHPDASRNSRTPTTKSIDIPIDITGMTNVHTVWHTLLNA